MKNILLAASFSLFAFNVTAQAPMWTWAQGGGGSLMEWTYGVAEDVNGYVYAAGGFESATATFGSQTLTNAMADTMDAFVVQYDWNGNVQWARRAGGVRTDEITSITTDNAGGVIVAGYFFSPTITFGTFTLTNTSGYSDAFLVRYDGSGTVTWATSFGAKYDDQPAAIETDAAGNIYATGFFLADTLFFGSDTLMCVGTYDVFALKFDNTGNPIWGRSEGTNSQEFGTAITIDATGNVIIGGTFLGTPFIYGTDTLIYSGGAYPDIFLAKYDTNGNLSWALDEGGTYWDEPKDLGTDALGNIYMAAMVYSDTIIIGNDTLLNSGIVAYCDVVVAQYNSSGVAQWAKKYGVGTGNDIVNGIAVEPNGDSYITGIHGPNISFDSQVLTGIGCFVVRHTSAGQVYWADNTINAYGSDILVTTSSQLYVSGMVFNASATFGSSYTVNNAGVYDVFVGHISQVLNVSENTPASEVFVFPNPTAGVIQFNGLSPNETYDVRITNVLGELVLATALSPGEVQLNLGELERGVYFVSVQGGRTENAASQKIILE